MDGSTEKVDGTGRVAAEVVPAIRTHPPITPELLHACVEQMKMLEMEIDQV